MQATITKPKNPFKMHSAQETSNFLSLPKVSPNQHTKATETQCDSFHLFCYAPGCPHNRLEPFFLLSSSCCGKSLQETGQRYQRIKVSFGESANILSYVPAAFHQPLKQKRPTLCCAVVDCQKEQHTR